MNADFLDSHLRHWEDAEMLSQATPARLANADHLYGFSAECGLKWLMIMFGMRPNPTTGDLEKIDRKHINKIAQRYESYRSGHPLAAAYALPQSTPFDDWDVDQRYAHRNGFDPARVRRHREGAEIIRRLVTQAQMDGLI